MTLMNYITSLAAPCVHIVAVLVYNVITLYWARTVQTLIDKYLVFRALTERYPRFSFCG